MNYKSDKLTCGSITIFLALSLTLIISVILSTVESSRRLAVSAYLEGITAMGMDSLFADYCIQLWEEYQIFSLVTNNIEFENKLKDYIEPNSHNSFLQGNLKDIKINEYSNLTDNYGEVFIDQLLSAMKYKEFSYIADYLLADSDIEYDPSDLSELADDDLNADDFTSLDFGSLFEKVEAANETLLEEDHELTVDLSDTFSLDALRGIMHIFDNTLIYYLVESPYDVSHLNISLRGLPSYYITENEGKTTVKYTPLDKFLIAEYIVNHFSSYTTTVKEFALKYQLEYILCGYDNDEDNLVECARMLVILRFGFNVAHILTDKDKMNTLASIAETTAAIPALPIIIETVLICLWAISESVIDVRDLLAGKKVNLIKTSDQWTLSIENLLEFDYSTESKNSGDYGLTYNNYLEMLLFKNKSHQLAARTLDLIQLDYSTTINDTFTISQCIVGASCDFEYTSYDIFSSVNFYHKTYFAPEYTITHNYYYQ